jgi:hypothetical protein
MPQESVELARGLNEAGLRGELDAVLGFIAEDVVARVRRSA